MLRHSHELQNKTELNFLGKETSFKKKTADSRLESFFKRYTGRINVQYFLYQKGWGDFPPITFAAF